MTPENIRPERDDPASGDSSAHSANTEPAGGALPSPDGAERAFETPALSAQEEGNFAPEAGWPNGETGPSAAENEGETPADSEPEAIHEAEIPLEFLAPRRAPRYGRFALAGILAGALLAIIIYLVAPGDGTYSASTIGFVLFLYCVPAGGAIGVLIALFVDRKSLKNRSGSSSLEQ